MLAIESRNKEFMVDVACDLRMYTKNVQNPPRHYDNPSYHYNYSIKDHLGTTRMVVQDNGTLKEALKYEPYGSVSDLDGFVNATNDPLRQKFTGKESDEQSGHMYFGARFYNPDIGMWTSTDPAEEFFNSYSYVGGDVVMGVDPDGRLYIPPVKNAKDPPPGPTVNGAGNSSVTDGDGVDNSGNKSGSESNLLGQKNNNTGILNPEYWVDTGITPNIYVNPIDPNSIPQPDIPMSVDGGASSVTFDGYRYQVRDNDAATWTFLTGLALLEPWPIGEIIFGALIIGDIAFEINGWGYQYKEHLVVLVSQLKENIKRDSELER